MYCNFDERKRAKNLEKYVYKANRLRNGGIKVYEINDNEFLLVQTVLTQTLQMGLGSPERVHEALSDDEDFDKSYIGANSFVNDYEFTRGAKIWGKQEWLEKMFENVEDEEIQKLITNSKFHCVARIYITNYNNRLNAIFPTSKKINNEYFNIRLDGLYE